MELRTILICFLVYAAATFIQRVCGFGMGILAIMVLPYLIGSHGQTAAYTNILSMCSATAMMIRYRKDCRFRLFIPVLCGSFVATFFAVRFSTRASFDVLEKLLGGVLLLLSIYFLFFNGKLHIAPRFRNGVIAGLCGGTLNGLFSAGGPPVVLYLLGTTESRAVYFATIQGYFAFNNIYATLMRILNGQLTPEMLPGLAGGFAGMVVGVLLGGRLGKYIPDKQFLRLIYILMGVSGLTMLF